jgi:hypothetical protein
MAQREDLSGVGERHRSLTRRVECGEQVDEESDQTQMRRVISGDVEAEPGCKQCPGHVRECEQQKRSAAEGVDCPDSRLGTTLAFKSQCLCHSVDSYPGEDEVDQSKAETCDQGIALTGASLSEHRGTVEGFKMLVVVASRQYTATELTDNVDTAL